MKWDLSEIQVTQRADKYNEIGDPEDRIKRRRVPLPKGTVMQAMKEWKLAQRGRAELVFETVRGRGTIEAHTNIVRSLKPFLRKAGLVTKEGGPRYSGLHCYRHFFASWCISPKDRGGRGLSPKVVQEWLGHSTIAMTMDTYGHLIGEVDHDEVSASTEAVLG